MNLSVLIHTFNGYQHLWHGQALAFTKHWREPGVPIYFGTDEPLTNTVWYPGKMIYSGTGQWSDRLKALLKQIPTDYVLYLQEDHWPVRKPPDMSVLMDIVITKNLLRLQVSPIVHFYTLFSEHNTIYFEPMSKYLVSHQPSIWKKSFLIDCLHKNETPWQNEYRGTLRWQENTIKKDFIRKKIAIYPCDWFHHACIKGRTIELQ